MRESIYDVHVTTKISKSFVNFMVVLYGQSFALPYADFSLRTGRVPEIESKVHNVK